MSIVWTPNEATRHTVLPTQNESSRIEVSRHNQIKEKENRKRKRTEPDSQFNHHVKKLARTEKNAAPTPDGI